MSFSRKLSFKTDATIASPVTIVLTFDKVSAGPSPKQIAWKTVKLGGPNQMATVTYEPLTFASIQVNDRQEVTAFANTAIDIGQRTSLVNNGPGAEFTPPTPGNPTQLTSSNETGDTAGLAIGFLNGDCFPNPLLAWPTVGNTYSVEAVHAPILSSYATSEYQETQPITGEIVPPTLLQKNLVLTPDAQTYTVMKNPDGSYSIVPASD